MAERLPRGVRRFFRLGAVRPEVDREVDDELAFHFHEAVREGMQSGLTREEALARAHADFGDAGAHRDDLRRLGERRARRRALGSFLATVGGALRGALKSAERNRALTAGIVITWSLGLGLGATMYGIVERLMLQPPDELAKPHELRHVLLEQLGNEHSAPGTESLSNFPDYVALLGQDGLDVAGYTQAFTMTVGSGATAVRAPVAGVFPGFFRVLGVRPRLGRFFSGPIELEGSWQPVVVSAERWRRAYGGDPEVLGRRVEIGGRTHTIVGVAPPGFTGMGLQRVDYWILLRVPTSLEDFFSPLPLPGLAFCVTSRRCRWMGTVARLRPDISSVAAASEASRRIANARRADGDDVRGVQVHFESIVVAARGSVGDVEVRLSLWLLALSVLVLLIATANVINLLLARGIRESGDMALRMVLGAGRWRVVAQQATETVVLSLASMVLALALARWAGGLIRSTLLPDVYFPDAGISPRVLGLTAATAMISALVASIVPALVGTRAGFGAVLKGAAPVSSPARSRLFVILTNLQVAVCAVLLVGAGLFQRSVYKVEEVDLGLDVDGLIQASLVFEDPALEVPRAIDLYEQAADLVRTLPGVASSALTNAPLGLMSTVPVTLPGLDSPPEWPGGDPLVRSVSPGYFETTGVAIVRGRTLRAGDPQTVTVVDETMASYLWPESEALGACIELYGSRDCTRVVGVAEPTATTGFQDGRSMAFYLRQDGDSPYQVIYVRTLAGADVDQVAGMVSSALDRSSPEILTSHVESLAALLDPQVRSWRTGAVLLSLFGALAVSLAVVGLYAVLAFDVAGRTREIGIRSALGAGRARLLWSVITKGAAMTGVGLSVGLTGAFLGAPYVRELLFDVSPRDPLVFVGVSVCLMGVPVAGALLPGVRAMRTSPAGALRAE